MNRSIKSIFREMPVLTTERLTLRKMLKSDYSDMFEYASDPEVTKYLTWHPHPDKNYTLKYLSYIQSKYKSGDFYDWAIVYNDKMIGTCGFTSIDPINLKAEIGYVISPFFRNRNFATEAVTRIIEFGFETLELNRLEAHYMEENSASRRVMEKCDMKFEGIYRESLLIKGNFVSVGVCSILKKDWNNK